MEMGAQEALDLDVVYLGPHGRKDVSLWQQMTKQARKKVPHYKRHTPIAFLASRASLVRWTIGDSSREADHVSA